MCPERWRHIVTTYPDPHDLRERGRTMIFRGPESFQYLSRKEFQHMGEIMDRVRRIQDRAQLPDLTAAVSSLIPHRFSANGSFHIQKKELEIGHSTYGEEHTHLYATQGYITDPAIQLLQKNPDRYGVQRRLP